MGRQIIDADERCLSLFHQLLEQTIMNAIHDVVKENPIEGGRPELMKDIEAKREICKEILQLFSEGVPLGVSHKRIAERHNISVRKVHRIWRERLTLHSAEPRTISDLVGAFSALSKLGE